MLGFWILGEKDLLRLGLHNNELTLFAADGSKVVCIMLQHNLP